MFDLGGGTFDCSLLSTFAGIAEVLTTGGDQWLGGDDWDTAMLGMLRAMLTQHGMRAEAEGGGLLRGAQRVKVALSEAPHVTVGVASLLGGVESGNGQQQVGGQRNDGRHGDGQQQGEQVLHVTRDAFEEATAALLARTLVPLKQLGEEGFVQWVVRYGGDGLAKQ